jgi:tetratricopeptide (TPR) repeat protein
MGIKKKLMDRIFRISFAVLLFFSLNLAYAQKINSYESEFNNGKELLNLKKFGLAMQAFKPLTNSMGGNPYQKIASFYYAVSAFGDEQTQVAKDMFLQIANKYPDWIKIDEVYLWLANIYLQEGDYNRGLTFASKIEKTDIGKSASELKRNYLRNMSYSELDSLLSLYPSDKEIAINLADKIAEKPIQDQDRGLLENIVSVFDLDKNKYRIEDNIQSVKKDRYQVALLLPFMHDEILENPKHIGNEFVIRIYEGILMGVTDLRSRGINVSLHMYDTKREGRTTEEILALDELKHMDLIIGPLYPEPVSLVSEFAFANKINMVNPLSFNSEIIKNNPYTFLFMPSEESQAEHAAEYLSNQLENKNLFIFHGVSRQDSVLAYSYKKEIERNGFTVCHIESVPNEEGKKILDILTNTMTIEFDASEFDSLVVEDKVVGNLTISEKDYLVIQPDSIGHVFIASTEPALVANTITGLETRRDTIMLVGLERWLDQRVISLSGLNKLHTHLIAPTYINKANPKYESLNSRYIETFNAYPTKDFYIGYEVMMSLGKLLKKSGNLFQFDPGVNNFIEGEIFQGFQYGERNSNQVVPIVKFEDAELILANPR